MGRSLRFVGNTRYTKVHRTKSLARCATHAHGQRRTLGVESRASPTRWFRGRSPDTTSPRRWTPPDLDPGAESWPAIERWS